METPNISSSAGVLVSPELKEKDITCSLDGPVAILWDIDSCPIPSDVRFEDVAGNVTKTLQEHPLIEGAVVTFSAYGDFNYFPRRLRECCQRTGVKLIDVPSGRKNAADKAILIDMFLFALDNRPPSSIMLISGDVDFAPSLQVLGQRGYTIILVVPSRVAMSTSLSNAAKFVWEWPSIARGEVFVPSSKAVVQPHVPTEAVAGLIGCHINDNFDQQNEEAIVYEGISQNYQKSFVIQSLPEYRSDTLKASGSPMALRSHSLPSTLNNAPGEPMAFSIDQNECAPLVEDLNGLKCQLVKLLEMSGGCLLLAQVLPEYQKYFGKSFSPSTYGVRKVMNLFKKMGSPFSVEGNSPRIFVYLRNCKERPLSKVSEDIKEKEIQEENANVAHSGFSVDGVRILTEGHDERSSLEKVHHRKAARSENHDQILEKFKHELQEILVSYSEPIFIDCFDDIYQLRYKKPLEYQKLGVDKLEDLFEKVSDVVALQEEPVSKRKFMVAVDG